MDEITQKNIVLISTCIIVICFHLAYKFRNEQTACNILLGIGFVVSLVMTKLLHGWEKQNKVDYNLILFLYIIVDLIIFFFLVYTYCQQKGIMKGGGNKVDIMDEFKKQDFMVNELSESPLTKMVGEKLKERITDGIVSILSKFRI